MRVFDHYAAKLSELDAELVRSIPEGGNWRDVPESFPSARIAQIRRGWTAGSGSRSTYYGRLRWDRPSYTIATYFNRPGNGANIHPKLDRMISIREAARLQGFPDRYRFVGSLRARHQQVGNAVPPLLAYRLGSALPKGWSVDLFCGVGGLSLGLEEAGFETALAVDRDTAALAAFRLNRTLDVTKKLDLSSSSAIDELHEAVRDRLGGERLTLLVGGPPCQGFSTAGRCDLDDPRNLLASRFVDAAVALRPDVVMMENVAALLWRRSEHVVRQIRARLGEAGYRTAIMLAHCEAFGVPQLRRRMILLATKSALPRWPPTRFAASEPLFRRYIPTTNMKQSRPPVTVYEAISDLPNETVVQPDVPSDDLDSPVSEYQLWARGEMSLGDWSDDTSDRSLTTAL